MKVVGLTQTDVGDLCSLFVFTTFVVRGKLPNMVGRENIQTHYRRAAYTGTLPWWH